MNSHFVDNLRLAVKPAMQASVFSSFVLSILIFFKQPRAGSLLEWAARDSFIEGYFFYLFIGKVLTGIGALVVVILLALWQIERSAPKKQVLLQYTSQFWVVLYAPVIFVVFETVSFVSLFLLLVLIHHFMLILQ